MPRNHGSDPYWALQQLIIGALQPLILARLDAMQLEAETDLLFAQEVLKLCKNFEQDPTPTTYSAIFAFVESHDCKKHFIEESFTGLNKTVRTAPLTEITAEAILNAFVEKAVTVRNPPRDHASRLQLCTSTGLNGSVIVISGKEFEAAQGMRAYVSKIRTFCELVSQECKASIENCKETRSLYKGPLLHYH